MDLKTLNIALDQIAETKGIPKEKIVETLEQALAAAYKKDYGKRGQIIRAQFNPKTAGLSFSQIKIVVDESMLKPDTDEDSEEPFAAPSETDLDTEGVDKKVRFNPER